ncbi:MAG: putative glycoside hydrolase [Oscillospiraceae bacterium]|nr:putative glycoside hydrolase [Oscillospiraceae bacterium]
MARRLRYRGRGRIRRALTAILIFFGVLFILAVVLFFALQNSAVYSADDNQVYLNCALLEQWRDPTPTPSKELPELPTPTPESTEDPPTSTPTPTPTPTPKTQLPMRALYAPIGTLLDEAAMTALREQLAKSEADALVLELKATDSTLAYSSSQPEALQAEVTTQSDVAAQLIRELKASGVYVIARVACFKDGYLPGVVRTVGIKVSNGRDNWLQGGRNTHTRWLDPYKEEARTYLLGVLSEIAALDVDEILLDWLTFPNTGSLSAISYGAFSNIPRYEPIETFAQDARGVVSSSGVALSVVLWEETCIDGEDAEGGQRLRQLVSLFDRLYVPMTLSGDVGETFGDLTKRLDALIPKADWPGRVVPLLTTPSGRDPDALQEDLHTISGAKGLGWVLENAQGSYNLG